MRYLIVKTFWREKELQILDIRVVTICLILMVLSPIGFAQSKEDIAYIKDLPAFTIYGDNYFITGTSLQKGGFSSETSDVKFKIGFKQRLRNVALPWGMFPFLGYQQKSFWDVYKKSCPFRETNYNPKVGLVKLWVNQKKITDGLWFAFEHESNGRDKENSRSWNFFSLTYFKPVGEKWQFLSKIWLPIGDLSDNADICSYRGYCSVRASYRANKNTFIDVDLQPAFKDKFTGFIKLSLSFKISKNQNQFLYIQYFGGYAEDLINYNKASNKLRIGIVLKDLFANFESKE